MILDHLNMSISESDKKRISEYIKENELDYKISDGAIFRYSINSYDDKIFYIHRYDEKYVVVKYDESKERMRQQAHFYFTFENIQQVLEQLSLYDDSLYKVWWHTPKSSMAGVVGFDKSNYNDEWVSNTLKTNENWKIDEDNDYKYLIYEEERKIKVISPFNELHKTGYYEKTYFEMDKLYFEVHPLDLTESNESYLVKVLINNEPILKEYINYNVRRRKGLRLFLENLFSNKNEYVKL
jgi:hypothetical protein